MHHLLEAFKPALLPSGKIHSRWRQLWPAEGQAILAAVPDADSLREAIYRLENELPIRPTCVVCGSRVRFDYATQSYNQTCSPRCGSLNPAARAKLKATNLERYGRENVGQFGTKEHNSSMIERYGVTVPFKNQELKAKATTTNLERYGAENVFASAHGVEAIKRTNLERRGVTSSMQDPTVKAKFYDETGAWKANKGIAVRAAKFHATQVARIRQRLAEYGFELLSVSGILSNYDNEHLLRHSCGHEFKHHLFNGAIPICRKCNPKLVGTSLLQKKVEDFLTEEGFEIETCKRLLGKEEIDIVVGKLGIEVNGLFWHSSAVGMPSDYHLRKTEAAAELGISLIHLYEDDLVYAWEIVKSMLRVKLGRAEKIYARKCTLEELPKTELKAFFEDNHLRGSAAFDFGIGLCFEGQLVCAASFSKPRYAKDAELELIRFCSIKNTVVVGGMSKLLSTVHQSILSYADRNHSTGNSYHKAGFGLVRVTKPSYWHFKGPENRRTHPTQLRKYKLLRSNPELDGSKTERELLQELGWHQIWDCGQLVFVRPASNKPAKDV